MSGETRKITEVETVIRRFDEQLAWQDTLEFMEGTYILPKPQLINLVDGPQHLEGEGK